MKNRVPFKLSETFVHHGIDWTKDPASEDERSLRQAYLSHETTCGPNGLVSLLLLAVVCRRLGSVAGDLQDAADHAEILLALKLRKHQDDSMAAIRGHMAEGGIIWS